MVRLTLFPAHYKEHVFVLGFVLIFFLIEGNQKGKKVPNDLNVDDGVAKKYSLRGDKDDGLLGKGMWLAGREPQ
jgi:hypothetical protein